MYSLGLLIAELETARARRRLRYVFEVPDGTPTSGLGTQPIPDGRAAESASHLAHSHTPCLCGSHKPAPLVTGDHAKWGLISVHSTAKEVATIDAPRHIPAQ